MSEAVEAVEAVEAIEAIEAGERHFERKQVNSEQNESRRSQAGTDSQHRLRLLHRLQAGHVSERRRSPFNARARGCRWLAMAAVFYHLLGVRHSRSLCRAACVFARTPPAVRFCVAYGAAAAGAKRRRAVQIHRGCGARKRSPSASGAFCRQRGALGFRHVSMHCLLAPLSKVRTPTTASRRRGSRATCSWIIQTVIKPPAKYPFEAQALPQILKEKKYSLIRVDAAEWSPAACDARRATRADHRLLQVLRSDRHVASKSLS